MLDNANNCLNMNKILVGSRDIKKRNNSELTSSLSTDFNLLIATMKYSGFHMYMYTQYVITEFFREILYPCFVTSYAEPS